MIKEFAEIEGVAGVHIMAIEWEIGGARDRRGRRPDAAPRGGVGRRG